MAISYSGYMTYVKCPSAFERKYITKEKGAGKPTREEAPQMYRGTDLHNAIEDVLLGKREDLPKEIEHYLDFVTGLKDMGAQPELPFAFDSAWQSVEFDDPTAEIRGYLDSLLAHDELTIHEWKSGKVYDEHVTQRNLYGLAGLLLYPKYDKVRVITTYLDQGEHNETTYHAAMLQTYKWIWSGYIKKTKPPQPYPMRPSWKCRFCQFSKRSGGLCPN